MLKKASIPWTTRLGRIGEAAIEKRLAYFSNPTKYETDAGLDFYCELIENDNPSTPFYIQAKGSEHFDTKWSSSIEKSTILYWLQQKFPVFLIVYDENDNNCYWMSIEDKRYEYIERIFKTDSKTIYITVDRTNLLTDKKKGNNEFIDKIKSDLISLELFMGLPQFVGDDYVKKIPPPPRTEIELKRIIERIRTNMYSMIAHYFEVTDYDNAALYCSFLTKIDTSHYNHFVWFARLNKRSGNIDEARKNYQQAIDICNRDSRWPKDDMKKIIEQIENEMKSLYSE